MSAVSTNISDLPCALTTSRSRTNSPPTRQSSVQLRIAPALTGAQDQLSYLHQLSFLITDPSLPAVTVTNGRRFYRAKLEILGWEIVTTGLGPTNALHVRSQLEGESRIDYWLAPAYGNLPVKVRVRDKRNDEFEQVLTVVKVTNP